MLSFPLQLTVNKFANIEKEISKHNGELFPGEWKENGFFPFVILHFATAVPQWEDSEFCFLRLSPHKGLLNFNCSTGHSLQGKTILLIPDVGEKPTYQAVLAPRENSVQESGFPETEKKVFWEFYVYRHSVTLFIIYGGVKYMKFSVNWIKSKFYWYFLVVITALRLM